MSSPRTPEPSTWFVVLEDQLLGKRGVAGADLFGGVEQDAELDGRSGLDGQVGGERGGLAGAQIVGVDSQLAVMGGGDGLKLLVERLVFRSRRLRTGKSAGQKQENGKACAAKRHGERLSRPAREEPILRTPK